MPSIPERFKAGMQLLLAAGLLATGQQTFAQQQTMSPMQEQVSPARNFDEAVDRAINNERLLVKRLSDKEPVIETYVQELKVDGDLGFVPKNDFYFLGQLDMKSGIVEKSFIPQSRIGMIPRLIKDVFTTQYNPGGFADEMFLDVANLNRTHYAFEYVRREFLGDVRCLVVDVMPNKEAGKRRFEGRLWLEDHDYNIVRFNGRYSPSPSHEFSHFDSWRVNSGALWLPSFIFSQDEQGYRFGPVKVAPMRAQTRLWDYERARERADQAFANMTVDIPQGVKDDTTAEAENSPVQEHRMWEEQASVNITDRLQRAGLMSPYGEVDQVLDTVLNNLIVTNNISLDPPIHARILLTTPLESIAVNHTILVSRGLIDVLPDESSLAAVLAHELAHIVLGHSIDTRYAFADRLLFDDPAILKKIKISRTEDEEKAADEKAVQLLRKSPYAANLPKIGLFLRMLSERSDEVPHLIKPLLGNKLSDKKKDLRLAGLMDSAPELKVRDKDQISALPLGSRVKMDPWSDQLRLIKTQNVALANAKEKLPFQITPFMLHLTREDWSASAPAQPVANIAPATPNTNQSVTHQ